MILGKSRAPVSGCLACLECLGGRAAGVVDLAGRHAGRRRLDASMAGCAVDVDHRRGVLVGREGQGSLPVKRVLSGDGLIERCRASPGVIAFLAPEPEPVAGLERAAADETGPARQAGDAGLDQNAVDVNPAQARAEAVVAHDHHAGPSFACELTKPPDRVIEAADHLGGGVVPVGPFDAGFIDVEIRPDPVLERVQILELNQEHRPVGNDPVGEPAAISPAAEALGGQSGVVGQLFERLRCPLPEVTQAVVGRLRGQAGTQTRGRPTRPLAGAAHPCPRRRSRSP